jgi:signal transduction histidine kinase
MDSTIFDTILQDRRIAYAITDLDLQVIELNGAKDVFEPQPCDGCSVLDLTPEMIGSEVVLVDILTGVLPRYQLSWVNRDKPGGQVLYLTLVYLPYRNQEGQIIGLLHLVEDVTEVGLLEQKLVQQRNLLRLLQNQLTHQNLELAAANAELKRLDEMKSIFVSIAAHELRSPLAIIRGYGEVILDGDVGPLTEPQKEYVQIIQNTAARLLATVSGLLDATRLEVGRLELALRPCDLSALLAGVVADFRLQVEDKSLRSTLHIAPNLPRALCDEIRATQIINNLLSNAIKYTPPEGSITVTLSPAQEEGFLLLAVADTGVGISSEDQTKLFDRFFRATSAKDIEIKGVGLGLYITRALVELHGGHIWLESELERGTTFYVTFPIVSDSAVK